MAQRPRDPAVFFANRQQRPRNAQPTATDRNWREKHSLRIYLRDLPSKVTTRQIYNNLEKYGTIVRINILENREGGRSSNAEVAFEPVPNEDFWRHNLSFYSQEERYNIRAFISKYQPEKLYIESPVTRQKYPERLEVEGETLDFGFLSRPQCMTVMSSTGPATLKLNLKKRELEVHFWFKQSSASGVKARLFRFKIALDDEFSIWQTAKNSFVMHLSKVPQYSKMLNEARDGSHSVESRMWSIEDCWARQTDICDRTTTYKTLNDLPVSLPKVHNAINISRWTTFRFHIMTEADNEKATTIFLTALKDWNVHVHSGDIFDFSEASADLEKSCWTLINDHYDETSSSGKRFQLDFSRAVLSFSIRYQLEVCLSHGYISEYSITQQFLERLAQWPEAKAKQALIYVATNRRKLYDPMVIFTELEYVKPVRPRQLPEYCMEVHSATVTATGVLFHTPSIEITNRIIRNHKSQANRFLRVRFEDDNYRGQTTIRSSYNNRMITVFTRIKRALTCGIKLGDITYEFLAWGNSQLRDHGVYMVAPIGDLTAEKIRGEMGHFKETVVAKKAARMGQCFSTTKPIRLRLPDINEKSLIPDIQRGRFLFTDGVGKISPLAATLISQQLGLKGEPPSLYQFRLGGCKGVLAVSKDVPGLGIQIRESQFKFNTLAEKNELEVIRWAEYWQPFLNRQIILCLDHLGVSQQTFIDMQDKEMTDLDAALINDGAALKALRGRIDPNMMTLSMCELVEAGFRCTNEPFLQALLQLWRAWSLKYLKEKAKIAVKEGAFVLGCVDEAAVLKGHTDACPSGEREDILKDDSYLDKLPEIFVQITNHDTKQLNVIEGLCILARNPSLHPGDIRVVRAVDKPELRHHKNVVVMPQMGDRDLSSMCSGGDLDGDDYIVIWDQRLIPRIWNAEPFHYEAPPPKKVASAITTSHLIDFFLDYLRNDTLGQIAHAHLGAADRLADGLNSQICLDLCALHSKAVDYPKTGVPAQIDRRLQRPEWPHFMEKTGRRQYHSHKILGKLYDRVKTTDFKPKYDLPFDQRLLNAFEPTLEMYEKVQSLKVDYDNSIRRILNQHDIQTEFELWSTFVLAHSKGSRDYKFHEEVGQLSSTLKADYYTALCELAGGKDFDHLAPVAIAAYKVTQYQVQLALQKEAERSEEAEEGETSNKPFISFPWVLQETLVKIASRFDNEQPKQTITVVKGGTLYEQEVGITIDDNGEAKVDVPDMSSLNLNASKLSRFLPDPLMTKMSITVGTELDEIVKPNSDVVDSSAVATPITDSPPDTPATDIEETSSNAPAVREDFRKSETASIQPRNANVSEDSDSDTVLGVKPKLSKKLNTDMSSSMQDEFDADDEWPTKSISKKDAKHDESILASSSISAITVGKHATLTKEADSSSLKMAGDRIGTAVSNSTDSDHLNGDNCGKAIAEATMPEHAEPPAAAAKQLNILKDPALLAEGEAEMDFEELSD